MEVDLFWSSTADPMFFFFLVFHVWSVMEPLWPFVANNAEWPQREQTLHDWLYVCTQQTWCFSKQEHHQSAFEELETFISDDKHVLYLGCYADCSLLMVHFVKGSPHCGVFWSLITQVSFTQVINASVFSPIHLLRCLCALYFLKGVLLWEI